MNKHLNMQERQYLGYVFYFYIQNISDTIFHQSCKQKYILSETNDVTNHSHDDTIPKVVLQSDDVDNGNYLC